MRVLETEVLRRVFVAEAADPRTDSLAATLRSNGYEVESLAEGDQVADRLQEDRFSIVIGDWEMGGLDLLTDARGQSDGSYAYVILTGEDARHMHQGMAAGADDFLVKPLDTGLLLARLRVAERLGRMQEAIASKNEELRRTNQELENSNTRMYRELTEAARVQQALLPARGFKASGTNIGWRLRPCTELAGDILNCVRLDERHLGFYVLDVCGHGVSSALLSVQVSRLMSAAMDDSAVLKQRLDHPPWYRIVEPRRVIHRLNQVFQTRGEVTQYFTILYGLLDLRTGQLRLAAGGHLGPIVMPAKGPAVAIHCRSHPVGLFQEPDFFSSELQLEIGDRVWFFSDGIPDASDRQEQPLGVERLQEIIESRRELPVQGAIDGVMDAVEQWSWPDEPDDDCTLLALERCAVEP